MNQLTLSVAGGGKTQRIVEQCARHEERARNLVLTYTRANQSELLLRLASRKVPESSTSVQGWFAFLLAHWVQPYLPRLYPNVTLKGLNFEGYPHHKTGGYRRYFDAHGRAYRCHLSKLATEVYKSCDGAVLDRLSRIYDRIWIDEVQDLIGFDLCVLELMLDSEIPIEMVGDVRQAILDTNPRDRKYPGFRGVNIKKWFDIQEKEGRVTIKQSCESWRCNSDIASLSDGIFGSEFGFESTIPLNSDTSEHRGIFAVAKHDAQEYFKTVRPMCLRRRSNLGTDVDLPFENIGTSKGTQADHVLILPTKKMEDFIRSGKALDPSPACYLYVAVTRAKHSVAFLSERPEELGLKVWCP